jgi:DNA-directed RNA polymerase specialized sigma24 family protein
MEMHWTYEGCDTEDEARIERYWDRQRIELDGKLAELVDVPSELRLAVECLDSVPEWTIHAALHVPGRTLVAQSTTRSPEQCIDLVIRGLAEEIDRLHDAPTSVVQRREGLDEMLPLLTTWRSQARSRSFMSFLSPIVETLGSYVQRELQIREREGAVSSEGLSAVDILDEVLIRAWDQFFDRPGEMPLDLWLVRLSDQVLDQMGQRVADESIDDEHPTPSRESRESERDEWIEQATYPETIALSELLPDGPGIDSWDDLELDAKQAHLAAMLANLDREQRQAFVLSVAHGYDLAEIADFQDRPVDQVESDIAQATTEIRRHLVDEQAPEQEEPFIRAEIRERQRRRW